MTASTLTKPEAPASVVTLIRPGLYELVRDGVTVARAVRHWGFQGTGVSGWIVDGCTGLIADEIAAVTALRGALRADTGNAN